MKYYKVLGDDGVPCSGGCGKWYLPEKGKPGKWMPKIEQIEPCVSGYHLCEADDILKWLNEEIYEAEGRGKSIRHEGKTVFQEARLVRKIDAWNEKSARLFSCDCAQRVLPIYEKNYHNDDRPRKAIETARLYANGKASDKELFAAGAAARDAAGAAASAAAWDAAGAAAGDAARAAAWDAAGAAARAAAGAAARAAAWDAARAAAWDAAWDAERKWQVEQLKSVLGLD